MKKIAAAGYMFFTLIISGHLHGQNFHEDYYKVIKAYASVTQCSTRVNTYLFRTEEDTRPASVLKSDVRYTTSGQWVKNEHMEMLYNNNCVLLIDHMNRQVQYSKPVDLAKLRKDANKSGVPDTSLLKEYTVTFDGNKEGVLHYRMNTRNTVLEFPRIEYRIDAVTYRFREIIYHCKENTQYRKIKVVYEYFDTRPVFAKGQFSETAIISGKGENARLINSYASYKLLNGYNQNIKKIFGDE